MTTPEKFSVSAAKAASNLPRLMLGLCLSAPLVPAYAQYSTSTSAHIDLNASTSYTPMAPVGQDDAHNGNAVTSSSAVAKSTSNSAFGGALSTHGMGTASAMAAAGTLQLGTAISGTGSSYFGGNAGAGGTGFGGNSNAFASFSDVATLGLPGFATGTQVRITYDIKVSGTIATSFTGLAGDWTHFASARYSWGIQVANNSYGSGERVASLSAGIATSDPVDTGHVLLQSVVIVGQPFTIAMNAYVKSSLSNPTYCNGCKTPDTRHTEANADFLNAFAWEGITGITDLDGHSIDLGLMRIDSASGFNYAQPVPEPSNWALLLLGLGLMATLTSKWRHHQADSI